MEPCQSVFTADQLQRDSTPSFACYYDRIPTDRLRFVPIEQFNPRELFSLRGDKKYPLQLRVFAPTS